MISAPLVSICIPTYNNARMVSDALASAMAQNHVPLEILVLDNNSSDDTADVIRRVAGDDPRVRYVRHDSNVGMPGNFNQALALATGELLLILCADDVLAPCCAAMLAEALVGKPSAVMAVCSRQFVDSQLRPMKFVQPHNRRGIVRGHTLILECFANGNIIGEPSSVMFRRSAAQRGFREDYHQLLDMEMWFHLLSQGDAVFLPNTLSRIRRHAEQLSNLNLVSCRVLADKRAFFREFAPLLSLWLSAGQKLKWDARMASSVVRTSRANGLLIDDVCEIFYPIAFRVFCALATATYAVTGLATRSRN